MVADWWVAKGLGEPGVMIAARKTDVADLNDRARELMLQEGKVRGEALSVAGGDFSDGDRVMTLCNSRALGVTNGTRGQVEAVDPERMEVRMRTDEGEAVTLPSSYLEAGHLTHAYAITGHKAQGMTTSRAFVLGDETVYREWGYVAISKAVGHRAEDSVSGSMTMRVVHLLKLVDVNHHYRQVMPVAPGPRPLRLQVLVQGAPVPNARQVIAARQLVLHLARVALLGQLLA